MRELHREVLIIEAVRRGWILRDRVQLLGDGPLVESLRAVGLAEPELAELFAVLRKRLRQESPDLVRQAVDVAVAEHAIAIGALSRQQANRYLQQQLADPGLELAERLVDEGVLDLAAADRLSRELGARTSCQVCGELFAPGADGERCASCGWSSEIRLPADDTVVLLEEPAPDSSGVVASASGDRLIGCTLGHCRILDVIGKGGMGTVYRARHRFLDLELAVKVMAGHLSVDEGIRTRLVREARVASRVDHPNLVRVTDVSIDIRPRRPDGEELAPCSFIVMELIDGAPLSDRLARGPLARDEALRIAHDTALALAAAHQEGLVHRDVKPENLMLTRAGIVKLTDFGLVKRIGAASGVQQQHAGMGTDSTSGELILGSPAYLAPEQANQGRVDARTDIYGLGVTLYAMLTGGSPFQRASLFATIRASCEEPLPPLDREPNLDALLARMAAKAKDDRLDSMEQVIAAFDRVRAGKPPFQAPAPVPAEEAPPAQQPPAEPEPRPDSRRQTATEVRRGRRASRVPSGKHRSDTTRKRARRLRRRGGGGGPLAFAIVVLLLAILGVLLLMKTQPGAGGPPTPSSSASAR